MGALILRALMFEVSIKVPDCLKLPDDVWSEAVSAIECGN